MELKSTSPSRIKTYQQCLFKYWLTYCTDISLKSNFGAANGSLIHDILENYAKGIDTNWSKRLYKGFAGQLETLDKYGKNIVLDSPLKWAKDSDYKNVQPKCHSCPFVDFENNKCTINGQHIDALDGCPKKLFEDSYAMTRAAIEKYTPIYRDSKIIDTEYKFELEIPSVDVKVIGVMDIVLQHSEYDDTIEIIDYKTGKWTQDMENCMKDIQSRIYSWAARKCFIDDAQNRGFSYKHVMLTFDYFQAHPVTFAFSEEEDMQTENYIINMVHRIRNTKKITRIIGDNDNFHWKCKSLCDPDVCAREWNGAFEV